MKALSGALSTKQLKKYFILLAVLGTPIVLFLVFKNSKVEYSTLPYYYNINFDDSVKRSITEFSLRDQNNKIITQDSIKGNIVIANFFFGNCEEICPKINGNIKIIAELLENNPEVKFISHSVDPQRDTVAALHKYAERFGANEEQWKFLTGPKSTIYSLASEQYQVVAVQKDTNTFIHSEQVILLDRDLNVRGYYNGLNFVELKEKLVDDVKILFKESKDKLENE